MAENFVVDNSVVMAWCFRDEQNRYADAILDKLKEGQALVPVIWPLEVVNVLAVAEKNKRLSEADSIRFITLLSQLPIRVEKERSATMMIDLLSIARANNLSSYDASYLYLAMREELPIATLDNRLRKAAKKSDVPIFNV